LTFDDRTVRRAIPVTFRKVITLFAGHVLRPIILTVLTDFQKLPQ
jgi:hypothetical protein